MDERIDALEKKIWEQERIVRYYDLSQNEDYAEKSQYYGGGDALQEMVNDPTTTGFWDNAAAVGKYAGPVVGTAALIYDGLTYDNLQHMTNDERADFNYLQDRGRFSVLMDKDAEPSPVLQWLLCHNPLDRGNDRGNDRRSDPPTRLS